MGAPAAPAHSTTDWEGWEDASALLGAPVPDTLGPASRPATEATGTAAMPLPVPIPLPPRGFNAPVPVPIPLPPRRFTAASPSGEGWDAGQGTSCDRASPVDPVLPSGCTTDSSLAANDDSLADLEDHWANLGIADIPAAAAQAGAGAGSSGWSSPTGSPALSSDGSQWGSSWDVLEVSPAAATAGSASPQSSSPELGGSPVPAGGPSPRQAMLEARAAEGAARQAANEAFKRSRRAIQGLKEEADWWTQRAIEERRKGRLAEAAECDRAARAAAAAIKAERKRAAADAYRRNNPQNEHHLADVDLHDMEVPPAMHLVEATVSSALNLAEARVYDLVTASFIPGWGKHSASGESKIMKQIIDLLDGLGIRYELENAGKVVAYFPAATL